MFKHNNNGNFFLGVTEKTYMICEEYNACNIYDAYLIL